MTETCPERKVRVGRMELKLKCQLDAPEHRGKCRAVLTGDVLVMWDRPK